MLRTYALTAWVGIALFIAARSGDVGEPAAVAGDALPGGLRYQIEPHKPFPPLPPAYDRVYHRPEDLTEAEALHKEDKIVIDGNFFHPGLPVQDGTSGQWPARIAASRGRTQSPDTGIITRI